MNRRTLAPCSWEEFKADALRIASRLGRPFNLVVSELMGVAWLVFEDGLPAFDPRRASFKTFFAHRLALAIRKELGLSKHRDDWPDDAEERFAMAPDTQFEHWRVVELSGDLEWLCCALRDADTTAMACAASVTRRRAQQLVAEQIRRARENGDLFAGPGV